MRWLAISLLPLSLGGCMEHPALRVGMLVLLPLFLVMLVLWLLNRRNGEEDAWEEGRLPDEDDDDNEEHHLM